MKLTLIASLILSACQSRDAVPAPVSCPAGEIPDGATCVPDICGVGSWGSLPVNENTVYVDVAASSNGDGSEAAPLTSIQAGLDLAGDRDGGLVAVAAGTYAEVIAMGNDHDGVSLAGRCKGLVTVDGSGGGGDVEDAPAIEIIGGARRPTIRIEGVTVTGGAYSGVWVQEAVVSIVATDVRENTLVGVLAADAEVALDAVGVYDTQPDGRGDYGRGIDAENEAALTATGCTVQGNTDVGVFVGGAGATVNLVDSVVAGTQPSPDGSGGVGIAVQDGATLTAVGCTVQGNSEAGVYVSDAGTSAYLEDTAALDTEPSPDGTLGRGIDVEAGAALIASGCTVRGNTATGVFASHAGTTVDLVDSVVADTQAGPDGSGVGIVVQDGAALSATGCTVQGNIAAGVFVANAGTTVDLVDSRVVDTQLGGDGSLARGINVQGSAALTATRCTLQGNIGLGLFASNAGTTAGLVDSMVADTQPSLDGAGGRGIQVQDGAALTATGCTVDGNTEVGVFASNGGTVDLVDSAVNDTHPSPNGGGGRGIGVQAAAALTLTGCAVQGNTEIGVFASGAGTTVDLVDSAVIDTQPSPDGSGGWGIGVQAAAALTATGCTVQGNTQVGVLASNDDTTVDLADSDVLDTLRGRETGFAIGLVPQDGALLSVTDSEVSGSQGPGLYVLDSATAVLERVSLTDNAFAGAVVLNGSVTLSSCTIEGTLPDAEWGGSFGVYASDYDGHPTLTLLDSTIGPHEYAALWLAGPGTYDIEGNRLSGSAGLNKDGHILHGNAVLAMDGVTSWDDATGLLLAENTFHDAAEIAVLLHAASATLTRNSWSANGIDVRQQLCAEVVVLTEAETDWDPEWEVCPEGNVLVAYDMEFNSLYLPEIESAG